MSQTTFNKIVLLLLCALIIGFIEAAEIRHKLEQNEYDQDGEDKDYRIVGGHAVSINKHPHQISLRRRGCPECSYEHLCGGSIFSEDVIITAAHCIIDDVVNNYMVVAGTENRRGSDGSITRVRKIVVHPNYDTITNDYDAALLFLASPLPLNDVTIASIALTSTNPKAGDRAVVTGWGNTKAGGIPSSKLMEVEVPVVNHEECSEAYTPSPITDNMICAGILGVGGKDSCQGDSGGPFVIDEQLAGIVSFGRSCADPSYPGVYANVYTLGDWIIETVEKHESE